MFSSSQWEGAKEKKPPGWPFLTIYVDLKKRCLAIANGDLSYIERVPNIQLSA
jgi:hypothetical protein